MKSIIRNPISKTHYIILGCLLIASILIWFEGPLLTFDHHQPLADTHKRLFLILALFILALIGKWIITPPEKNTFSDQAKNPETLTQLHILKGRFEGAIQFLKKTQIFYKNKSISLASLPWYVLIGPTQSGKTSLLAKSGVQYTLTKQFKQEQISASDNCDWWATKELVLIDIPGYYLKKGSSYLRYQFIKLIKKFRGSHGLNAIVIALPFPEFSKKQSLQQKKQIIADIKEIITEFHHQFTDQIPIYLIVTKCDLIPGFSEFFAEAGTEELAQPWGITIPKSKENESVSDLFLERFNALIKKLNSQLIAHLHTERNLVSRSAIKDFPLQLERLKENINHFIKALSIKHLNLHGVYLTSSEQPTDDTKPAQSQLIHHGNQSVLQLLKAPVMPSKSFFVRQVLLQGLLWNGEPVPVIPQEKWKRQVTYAASVGLLLLATVFLGRDFQQSILLTYAIQNDLMHYQNTLNQKQNKNEFLKILPLLNSLKARVNDSSNLFHGFTHLTYYSKRSQHLIQNLYQQALQSLILPSVKNNFEHFLKNPSKLESSQLYAALQAYLMLGDKNHLQPSYIVKTLQQLNSKEVDNTNWKDLTTHLIEAFKLNPPLELDRNLINQTRLSLLNLSKLEVAFIILKNINDNGVGVSFDENSSIFLTSQTSDAIPALFTGEKFSRVLTLDIPFAAKETLQGNWVLGSNENLVDNTALDAFQEQLRTRYIENYVSLWESKLLNTKLATPTSLVETDAMISAITSNTSPLLTLLKTIKQNTSFAPILKASPKLSSLNNLLANAHNEQENTLYEIFVSLRKLHFYLETITNTNDVGLSAFNSAKNRIQNASGDAISMVHLLAQQNSEPMRSWLHNLANLSWYFILSEASRYIENEWQLNITTLYRSQIANHYPLDANSNQEIDIQQFVNFAGKEGTLVKFYDRYLKPFVLDEANSWQWRSIENQKLPFSNNVLTLLQQALKIQNVSKFALFSQGQRNAALQRFKLPLSLNETASN